EVDKQRRAFVDETASDRMRQRQTDDERPALHGRRHEHVRGTKPVVVGGAYSGIPVAGPWLFEPQGLEHSHGIIAAYGKPGHSASERTWAIGIGAKRNALVACGAREAVSYRDSQH